MATTQNTYTGNGSLTEYSFTFPYLEESDVKVSLDGVDQATSEYSFANATTISFNTAPANGVAIRIYRVTATDSAQATFFAGSAIRAQDLNDNNNQLLYATQETVNRRLDSTGGTMTGELDMSTNKIVNVGTPTAAADAATKAYVDGVAIAGIGTGTARQLLQTNAAATAVEFTSNIDVPGTLDVTGVATFDSDVTIASTGALTLPDGVTGDRPTGVTGMIRFNTSLTQFEGYNGTDWGTIGGGATGGGADTVFFENSQTVTTNYTLTTNKNAVTAGPITINSGVTVTVPSGQSWVIV
jgi:hypothetical protein